MPQSVLPFYHLSLYMSIASTPLKVKISQATKAEQLPANEHRKRSSEQ
jgi:hypothetical protein